MMGYYIQTPENLNKVRQLVRLHGAEIIPFPPEKLSDIIGDKALICVVQNGTFDAAGLCYNQQELEAFRRADEGYQRPRTWLLMDKAEAHELCGYKEK